MPAASYPQPAELEEVANPGPWPDPELLPPPPGPGWGPGFAPSPSHRHSSRPFIAVVTVLACVALLVSFATLYLVFWHGGTSPGAGMPPMLGAPAWNTSAIVMSMPWAPSDTNVSFGWQGGTNGVNATVGLAWNASAPVWLYLVNGAPAASNCSLQYPQPSSCGGYGNALIQVNASGVGNSGPNGLFPLCWSPCTPGPIFLFVFNSGTTSVSVSYQLWWNSSAPPPGPFSGTVVAPLHTQLPNTEVISISGYAHETHYNWSKGVTLLTGATCVGWIGPSTWEYSYPGMPDNPNGSAYAYIAGPGIHQNWTTPTTTGMSMVALGLKCWMPRGGILTVYVWP